MQMFRALDLPGDGPVSGAGAKRCQAQWHLLRLMGLEDSHTTAPVVEPFPWHLQPLVGLGAALARPGLYSTGPIADPLLRDRMEEDRGAIGGAAGETLSDPFGPELYRMFEARLPRMHAGLHCCLSHQEADQIVGEQVYPELLLAHLRCLATQHFHAQSRLDVAQVELSGKGLARYQDRIPSRFQPLPIGTAREVFPQAARPRGIRRKGYGSSRSWGRLSRELPEARGWMEFPVPVHPENAVEVLVTPSPPADAALSPPLAPRQKGLDLHFQVITHFTEGAAGITHSDLSSAGVRTSADRRRDLDLGDASIGPQMPVDLFFMQALCELAVK